MAKAAFIQWYGKVNGQERSAHLRAGANGTGKILQTVKYWPHSSPSRDAAANIFEDVAKRDGYTIVGSDRDEA